MLVVSANFGHVSFWPHRQALVALMALSLVSLQLVLNSWPQWWSSLFNQQFHYPCSILDLDLIAVYLQCEPGFLYKYNLLTENAPAIKVGCCSSYTPSIPDSNSTNCLLELLGYKSLKDTMNELCPVPTIYLRYSKYLLNWLNKIMYIQFLA